MARVLHGRTPELPIGFAHGFWINMTVADMDRYLPYLIGRFSRSGGVVETGHIGSFDELSSEPVIVNCAGIGDLGRSVTHPWS